MEQKQKPRKIPQRQCLGRGAYICRDVACLRKARKSKRIDRSLECTVPEEVYDRMEAELSGEDGR